MPDLSVSGQHDTTIAQLARYADVPLPRKPRLAGWVKRVDLGDDRLQLRAAEFAFTIHPYLVGVFRRIEPLLDGSRTVDEIANAGTGEFAPTTAVFLLKVLRANGVLQEAEAPEELTREELAAHDRQLRFLSHFVADAERIHVLLERARVGVLGGNVLASRVRAELGSSGVGAVADLGASVEREGDAARELEAIDLVVACADGPGFQFFAAVNEWCLARGVRWLRTALYGVTAQLGPTFVPFQTACYTCFERRVDSHLAERDGQALYRAEPADEGAFEPFTTILAAQTAIEVLRLLAGFAPPTTVGRFHELTVATPAGVGHDVLKVPRCPSCGGGAPPMQAWAQEVADTQAIGERM